MVKIKIVISGKNLHSLKDTGKYHCQVCGKGVGRNSICCNGGQLWIDKVCVGIKGNSKDDPRHRCKKCKLMEDLKNR